MRFFAFLLLHLLSLSTVSAEETLPPIYEHTHLEMRGQGHLAT